MTIQRQVAMLLSQEDSSLIDWELYERRANIIQIRNFALLSAAFEVGISELRKEITAVIFDRSISDETFLGFLAGLTQDFRGDVLHIREDGCAYLCAMAAGDGRVMLRLGLDDVHFYLTVNFGSIETPLSLYDHEIRSGQIPGVPPEH